MTAPSESAESCPKCAAKKPSWLKTYRPLLLIIAYILLVALLAAGDNAAAMRYFMAGFFIVFSFFKMLDIEGFAAAYARYDLLAARWRGYGYAYPFIELALGLAYLTNALPMATNVSTLALMLFSGAGVLNALRQGKSLTCACLGTTLNLPMSAVTVIEDFGMAAMAAVMLLS